jgi:hypothetical protein
VLSALKWVCDLQQLNINFRIDLKIVVDSIYGGRIDDLDFSSIINDRRRLLSSDLENFDLMFIGDKPQWMVETWVAF